MKKIIMILGIMMLLIPINSYAETEWHPYETYLDFDCISKYSGNYYFGTEISYENGTYTISGDVSDKTIYQWENNLNDYQFAYTCSSKSLECSEYYAVIRYANCRDQTGGYGYAGVVYRNGLFYDGNPTFYVGKSYTKENGIYTLVDPEEHSMTEINGREFLSTNFEGYYICADNYKTSCSSLYYIAKKGNNQVGYLFSHVVDVEDYYLVSDSYLKIGDTFQLLDPKKAYLAADGGVTGYTCRSQEDSCEQLYRIEISNHYDNHDGGRPSNFEELFIENNSMEKTIKIKESFDIETFFDEEEIASAFSTNPEVADIVDQKLVLYRIGETDLIYEDDFTYKVIHLKVLEDPAPIQNPNTGRVYLLVVVVLLGVLSLLTKVIPSQRKREE